MSEPRPVTSATAYSALSVSDWLRLGALGAMAGATAGGLFGLAGFVIQTVITQQDTAIYGDAAVDHGAPFLSSGVILSTALLGGFVGMLYAGVRARQAGLARWRGTLFAGLVAVGLQPLLAGRLSISAVVSATITRTTPAGYVKSGPEIQDLASHAQELALMVGLVFLMALVTHVLLELASRRLPRLPAAVYAVIACAIGLPGLAIFGLFFLAAIGAVGGE